VRQRSINDCWWNILGTVGGDRLQTIVKEELAAFIGTGECEIRPAPSWNWALTERQWLFPLHHGNSQCEVAVIFDIHRFDCFCMLTGSRTLSGSSVNEISCYCPGGCCRDIPCLSAYKGCCVLVSECLWSSATHITEDGRQKIIDAPLTLILSMGQGGYCYLYFL